MPSESMKLIDKGPIQPPPVLRGPAQAVSVEIQSWPGIISATHWTIGDSTRVNGADFYVGEEELGHIHLDGEIHLLLTSPLRKALISAGLAEPFPYGKNWIQMSITDSKSAQIALWLFELGYDRLNGVSEADLLSRL